MEVDEKEDGGDSEKRGWTLEDDDEDEATVVEGEGDGDGDGNVNGGAAGERKLDSDTDEPALPSLMARGSARASEPGSTTEKGLPAVSAPAAAVLAANGGGVSAPGAVPSGPLQTAPLSGSTTGAKRPGKWRSLFEDAEDRDYMESVVARGLAAPVVKRLKVDTPEPAPAPSRPAGTALAAGVKAVPKPAPMEEDDDVDPLDAFMAGVTSEVKKIHDATRQQNQVARSASSSAAAHAPRPGTPTGAPATSGAKGPPAKSSKAIVEDTDDEDDAGAKSTNEDDEDIFALASKHSKKKDLPLVDHSKMNYPPFKTNFYIEPPEVAAMTDDEVAAVREELDNIKIRGQDCPKPIRKWTHCGLNLPTLEVIKRNEWGTPTSIQAQAIPAIMSGRDVIGVAKTGSGKTLAFILPMFRHIKDQPPLKDGEGPIGLILTPTRELALQIYNECRKFTKVLHLNAVCAYGGAPMKDQIADLKRGAEIIVCTPGRMIDLLTANSGRVTNLRRVTYLVLDEADRMFDLGFEPQVMKIIQNIRPNKQMVLFSATFPRQMEALARRVLRRPIEIQVGGRSVVPPSVKQFVEVRPEEDKFLRLLELLGQKFDAEKRTLVFVDRQDAADMLFRQLLGKGYPCLVIHGGKDQSDRDQTLADFKSGVCSLLIATSVLARGLDVKLLNLVVNYDVPNHMEDYVHRCGRTGRAGAEGDAYTFITPEQEKFAGDIVKALEMSQVPVPEDLQKLADSFKKKVESGEARYHGSGFSGKGLLRIEMAHAMMKQTQRLTYGGAEGTAPDEEEEEEEEVVAEDGELVGTRKKLTFSAIIRTSATVAAEKAAAAAAATTAAANRLHNGMAAAPLVVVVKSWTSSSDGAGAAAPAAAGAASTEPGHAAVPAALSEAEAAAWKAAQERAAALNLALRKAGAAGGGGAGSSSGGGGGGGATSLVDGSSVRFQLPAPPPGGALGDKSRTADLGKAPREQEVAEFWAEIEINDFPQTARWRVTNKETMSQLAEFSKAAITTRGNFYGPGQRPKEGERKLYLMIEGLTQQVVDVAVNEIRRLLTEATVSALERGDRPTGGRYTVV